MGKQKGVRRTYKKKRQGDSNETLRQPLVASAQEGLRGEIGDQSTPTQANPPSSQASQLGQGEQANPTMDFESQLKLLLHVFESALCFAITPDAHLQTMMAIQCLMADSPSSNALYQVTVERLMVPILKYEYRDKDSYSGDFQAGEKAKWQTNFRLLERSVALLDNYLGHDVFDGEAWRALARDVGEIDLPPARDEAADEGVSRGDESSEFSDFSSNSDEQLPPDNDDTVTEQPITQHHGAVWEDTCMFHMILIMALVWKGCVDGASTFTASIMNPAETEYETTKNRIILVGQLSLGFLMTAMTRRASLESIYLPPPNIATADGLPQYRNLCSYMVEYFLLGLLILSSLQTTAVNGNSPATGFNVLLREETCKSVFEGVDYWRLTFPSMVFSGVTSYVTYYSFRRNKITAVWRQMFHQNMSLGSAAIVKFSAFWMILFLKASEVTMAVPWYQGLFYDSVVSSGAQLAGSQACGEAPVGHYVYSNLTWVIALSTFLCTEPPKLYIALGNLEWPGLTPSMGSVMLFLFLFCEGSIDKFIPLRKNFVPRFFHNMGLHDDFWYGFPVEFAAGLLTFNHIVWNFIIIGVALRYIGQNRYARNCCHFFFDFFMTLCCGLFFSTNYLVDWSHRQHSNNDYQRIPGRDSNQNQNHDAVIELGLANSVAGINPGDEAHQIDEGSSLLRNGSLFADQDQGRGGRAFRQVAHGGNRSPLIGGDVSGQYDTSEDQIFETSIN